MNRRMFCRGVALATVALPLPALAKPIEAILYKNPQCGCCEGYAAYLRQNGFTVDVKPTNDLAEISQKAVVPAAGGRVLEIGVGSGLNLPLYGVGAERVIGLDPSPSCSRWRASDASRTRASGVVGRVRRIDSAGGQEHRHGGDDLDAVQHS